MLNRFNTNLSFTFYPLGDLGILIDGSGTGVVLNAAGKSLSVIGQICLEQGYGSKTISSNGGKIWWRTGTVTAWADAGTTLRVGIQTVAATGIESEVYGVYKDLIPGTDALSASTIYATPVSNGSLSISHRDMLAIIVEMTTRGGSDQLQVTTRYAASNRRVFPYGTVDEGSGTAKHANFMLPATIEFDDGTIGFIQGAYLYPIYSNYTYNLNSTYDEYAMVFKLPFSCEVEGCCFYTQGFSGSADAELILYSDPLGTPVAETSVFADATYGGITDGHAQYYFANRVFLQENVTYALAARAYTTTNFYLRYINFGTGNTKLKNATPLGQNVSGGYRANQTGAFTEDSAAIPCMGLMISGIMGSRPTLVNFRAG